MAWGSALSPARKARPFLALTAILALLLVACGPGSDPIPPNAQQVHIIISDSTVNLDPSVVHAGDVYLVLDSPADGSLMFVQRKTAADEEAEPLSSDDMIRLDRGDTQGMSISGLDAGGCDGEQNAAGRGQMGPCGNVMQVTLSPGYYAIVGDAPETATAPLAFLEVLP